jgi:hypothetical protein
MATNPSINQNIKILEDNAIFLSDRTCCVCRINTRPIQIHHIDGNHSNYNIDNLSVLCIHCHDETLIKGGFGRKLNPEQVILYRNDWLYRVAKKRGSQSNEVIIEKKDDLFKFIQVTTSEIEAFRKNDQKSLIAIAYEHIGNRSLRDTYIEESLKQDPSDSNILFLRGMQSKMDLVPKEVIERQIHKFEKVKDWSQLARLYRDLKDYKNAAVFYMKGAQVDIKKGNLFSAAYYLKELYEEKVIDVFFILTLKEARKDKNLHLQVRCLEELGWKTELKTLLLNNRDTINSSDDIHLKIFLADALNDHELYIKLRTELAERTFDAGDGVIGFA